MYDLKAYTPTQGVRSVVKYDEKLIGEVKFTKGKFVVEFNKLAVDLCDINDKILVIGDVYAKKIE